MNEAPFFTPFISKSVNETTWHTRAGKIKSEGGIEHVFGGLLCLNLSDSAIQFTENQVFKIEDTENSLLNIVSKIEPFPRPLPLWFCFQTKFQSLATGVVSRGGFVSAHESGSGVGDVVVDLSDSSYAKDPDNDDTSLTRSQQMTYEIQSGDSDHVFLLQPRTGQFLVNSWLLDREIKSEYHITISIRDDGLNYKWINAKEKAMAIDATVQIVSISSGVYVETLQHSQFWVPPPSVSAVSITAVGGGGAGAPQCGDGGDGGEIVHNHRVSVTQATVYEVIVGSGGVAMKHSGECGGNGTGSGIKSLISVWAKGGNGGCPQIQRSKFMYNSNGDGGSSHMLRGAHGTFLVAGNGGTGFEVKVNETAAHLEVVGGGACSRFTDKRWSPGLQHFSGDGSRLRSNIFGKSGTNYAGDGGGGASCSSVCNISSTGGNGGHGVVMLEYEKKEELIGEFRLICNSLITNHITANSSAENMRRALTEVFDFGEIEVSRSADSGDDGTSWSITFVDTKSPPKLLQSEHTLQTISGRKAKVKITTISTKVEG